MHEGSLGRNDTSDTTLVLTWIHPWRYWLLVHRLECRNPGLPPHLSGIRCVPIDVRVQTFFNMRALDRFLRIPRIVLVVAISLRLLQSCVMSKGGHVRAAASSCEWRRIRRVGMIAPVDAQP